MDLQAAQSSANGADTLSKLSASVSNAIVAVPPTAPLATRPRPRRAAKTAPKTTTIRNWPESERPREKLLERGPQALSEAELVALLLGSGTKGRSAVDIARALLTEFGSLSRDAQCRPAALGRQARHWAGTLRDSDGLN